MTGFVKILVLNKCDKPRKEKDTGRSMAELSEENEADPEGFLEDEWDESGGSEVMRSEDGEVEDWLGDEDDGITEVSKQVGTLELDSPDWAEVHRRVVPETVLRTSARTGEGIPELLQVVSPLFLFPVLCVIRRSPLHDSNPVTLSLPAFACDSKCPCC